MGEVEWKKKRRWSEGKKKERSGDLEIRRKDKWRRNGGQMMRNK